MAVSQPQLKKRALVVAILAIAAVYNVQVDVQREHESSCQDRCPVPTCIVVARSALALGEK